LKLKHFLFSRIYHCQLIELNKQTTICLRNKYLTPFIIKLLNSVLVSKYAYGSRPIADRHRPTCIHNEGSVCSPLLQIPSLGFLSIRSKRCSVYQHHLVDTVAAYIVTRVSCLCNVHIYKCEHGNNTVRRQLIVRSSRTYNVCSYDFHTLLLHLPFNLI